MVHVVHRAVWTELAELLPFEADVEQLTLSLNVSIIPGRKNPIRISFILYLPSILFVLTSKGSLRHVHSVINWKIYSRSPESLRESKIVCFFGGAGAT